MEDTDFPELMASFLRRAVAVGIGSLCSLAMAGPVIEMSMKGQPLQYTKDGRINGCGIRIVGTTALDPQIKRVRVIDASFNLSFPFLGIIKGGMLETTYAAVNAGNLQAAKKVRISNIWMKAPNESPTQPVSGKPLQGEIDKSSLMYPTQARSIIPLVTAVQEGQPIQIGFRVPADDSDAVFFGRVEMTEGESAQFADCMAQWAEAARTNPGTALR